MRKLLLILMSLLCLISSGLVLASETSDIYRLRPGDTMMISVWREEALQRQVLVLPDGSITFPLIGRIVVSGLSTPDVERKMIQKLKEYYPDPIVTVVIVGIDGHRAFVTGKVMHPGALIVNGPISVLQAISLSGGFDRFADENGIKLVRTSDKGQEILNVNYKDIISGKNMDTNFLLQAGDTLVVP